MTTTFNDKDHPRNRAGEFTTKPGAGTATEADIELTPSQTMDQIQDRITVDAVAAGVKFAREEVPGVKGIKFGDQGDGPYLVPYEFHMADGSVVDSYDANTDDTTITFTNIRPSNSFWDLEDANGVINLDEAEIWANNRGGDADRLEASLEEWFAFQDEHDLGDYDENDDYEWLDDGAEPPF